MLVVEDRPQRRFRVSGSAELQLRVRDGVKARGIEHHAVSLRQRLHPFGDLHRLMRVAGVVLEPREIVEDLDAQRDVVEPVGELQRGAIAFARRVPRTGAHQNLTEAEEVVGAHSLGHGVVQQLDRAHRVLPRTRHVADEVEEHGQQPAASRHQMAMPVLGRPLVDLPDQLAARRVLALATEHIGLDQLRAPLLRVGTEPAGASLEHHCGLVRGVRIGERQHLENVQFSGEPLDTALGGRRDRSGLRRITGGRIRGAGNDAQQR